MILEFKANFTFLARWANLANFVVTCALANKLARIAWALTARQQTYEA
nr:hypothetical protein [Enterobacter hormaechei]